ncbi:MAG: pyridoxamine 5'-phosphate oxidase [Pseudomonadota bacterium]|nr:pyridoxamine 5'-phosphate oxidase [Pseudomonadota bacterium]
MRVLTGESSRGLWVELYREAIERFENLLEEAKKTDIEEPAAMSLSTAGRSGRSSVRTVSLSHMDERGFAFYTDLRSRKARELADNPYAALCFFWQPLGQQVIVEGPVETVDDDDADGYWETRRRDCQIAAWASPQSSDLENQETLERRVAAVKLRFMDRVVPRPPEWVGFRLVPDRIEFWKAGWHRLHTRVCYRKQGDAWSRRLLYP